MVLQVKSNTAMYNVPRYGDIPNIFFGTASFPTTIIDQTLTADIADLLGTSKSGEKNPIVGSWFRIEKGPESTPPTYSYDEVGVVIEGEINLRDEIGQTVTVSYGLAWKCGGREMAKL
ncbi:hypothetical protein AKAW_07082 [Aspergillus luchuensis IFO 4308]|nr:hypothetical protein AKAW_07082 [Aspergillus luchuensis IFO 4308]